MSVNAANVLRRSARRTVGSLRIPPVSRAFLIAIFWLAAVVVTLRCDQTLEAAWDRIGDDVPSFWFMATVLTAAVTPLCIALVVLLISAFDRRGRWRLVRIGAVVMLSQEAVCEIIKHLFGRLRPDASGEATVFLGPSLHGHGFSFPSGHAMAAFALAAVLTGFYPRWRWMFLVAAMAVAVARQAPGAPNAPGPWPSQRPAHGV